MFSVNNCGSAPKAENQTVPQLGRNVRKKKKIETLSEYHWTCLLLFEG